MRALLISLFIFGCFHFLVAQDTLDFNKINYALLLKDSANSNLSMGMKIKSSKQNHIADSLIKSIFPVGNIFQTTEYCMAINKYGWTDVITFNRLEFNSAIGLNFEYYYSLSDKKHLTSEKYFTSDQTVSVLQENPEGKFMIMFEIIPTKLYPTQENSMFSVTIPIKILKAIEIKTLK